MAESIEVRVVFESRSFPLFSFDIAKKREREREEGERIVRNFSVAENEGSSRREKQAYLKKRGTGGERIGWTISTRRKQKRRIGYTGRRACVVWNVMNELTITRDFFFFLFFSPFPLSPKKLPEKNVRKFDASYEK